MRIRTVGTLLLACALATAVPLAGCGTKQSKSITDDATSSSTSRSKSLNFSYYKKPVTSPLDIKTSSLTGTFGTKGVTIPVDPSWQTKMIGYAGYASVDIGARELGIYIYPYYHDIDRDITKTLEGYSNSIEGLGGVDFKKLREKKKFEIDGGTVVRIYEDENSRESLLALGYNKKANKGFALVAARFHARYKDWDEAVDYMMEHVSFNPDEAEDASSDSSSSSASNTDNSQSTQTTQNDGNANVITAGMYKVGTDIPAGEYKLTAEGNGGFWQVTNSSDANAEIVGNDFFTDTAYVTVKDGQYLKITSCTGQHT